MLGVRINARAGPVHGGSSRVIEGWGDGGWMSSAVTVVLVLLPVMSSVLILVRVSITDRDLGAGECMSGTWNRLVAGAWE
jgi:hypothetical protein